jgi:hypothetical protein
MEEGILDLGCPMIYRNESTYPGSFDAWCDYAKDSQYNRAAAAGMGWYLNSISNTITQFGVTREASPGGNSGAGFVGYSYAVPNKDGVSQDSSWAQFVEGPLSSSSAVPAMPWRLDETRGHLMGTVTTETGSMLDGATLLITGPTTLTVKTDATGFFGAVDLPVGSYTVSVGVPDWPLFASTLEVSGAHVAKMNVTLRQRPFEITSHSWNHEARCMTLTWNSVAGRTYRVELSKDLVSWIPLEYGIPPVGASTTWTSTALPISDRHFFRVAEQ